MKRNLFIAILLANAVGGACFAQVAPAGPAASSAPPAAAPAATTPLKHGYDPNQQICKWTEEIGTRLGGGRVCMTRAQWDQQSRDAEDDLNDTTQHAREASPPGH